MSSPFHPEFILDFGFEKDGECARQLIINATDDQCQVIAVAVITQPFWEKAAINQITPGLRNNSRETILNNFDLVHTVVQSIVMYVCHTRVQQILDTFASYYGTPN